MEEQQKLIKTPLSIVYFNGTNLTTQIGLDLNKKDKVWGVEFSNGVMVSVGADHPLNWSTANFLAGCLLFEGKSGSLPSPQQLEDIFVIDKAPYILTCSKLKHNGIKVDLFDGVIWCNDAKCDRKMRFNITDNSTSHAREGDFIPDARLAVVF